LFELLLNRIPKAGPPRAEPLCKPLGHGLFEFRRQPKGKKLRVIWFYGGGAVIVCAVAFTKAERTPRTQIERARALKKAYLEDKRDEKLEISND
jgi:phage-related protein